MKPCLKSACLLAAVLGGFLLPRLTAQTSAKPAATGDTSTVVFENERVRVILYHTTSGANICGLGLHSHPAHLYIQLQPAKFRVTTPDGKQEVLDTPAGDVGWEGAVTHRVELASPGTVDTYLVEVKDKDWKPSTNLSR